MSPMKPSNPLNPSKKFAPLPTGSIVSRKSQPSSLSELIEGLRDLFAASVVDVDLVMHWMGKWEAKRSDWQKYAKFDPFRYTRNLVDEGNGKFNLMLLCWSEGQGTRVHDHADSHCFMKILVGEVEEVLYDWPEGGDKRGAEAGAVSPKEQAQTMAQAPAVQELRRKWSSIHPSGAVAYINDSIGLHRMQNLSDSAPAASLHLYSPPFEECRSFEETTSKANVIKMTFYSRFGEQMPSAASRTATEGKLPKSWIGLEKLD